MKALTMELDRLIRMERVNRKHAKSLKSGRAGKRFEWLTINMIVSGMAAYGQKAICRIVKLAENEVDYAALMREASHIA